MTWVELKANRIVTEIWARDDSIRKEVERIGETRKRPLE